MKGKFKLMTMHKKQLCVYIIYKRKYHEVLFIFHGFHLKEQSRDNLQCYK